LQLNINRLDGWRWFWPVLAFCLLFFVSWINRFPDGMIFAGGDVVQYFNQEFVERNFHHIWSNIMGELLVGLAEYFVFYNGERPHQSLGNKTPDVVYRTAIGGGAMIVDKFPRAAEGIPVERSGTAAPTAAARSEVTATAKTKVTVKPGQRRPAASEVECAA